MLIWLVLIPLIAAALIGLCKAPARPTALLSASLTLALGIWALVSFDGCSSCWSRFEGMDLQLTLAPALSKVMLLLTILVTFATVLGTNPPQGGEASWYNSALLISAGATGAFLSDNIISFFAFHELALIPTFVMIGLYGRGDRRTTAWRATLYLGLASMVLLAALLMIGTQAGFTFSGLKDFMASGRELAHAELIGALLIAGFGTLISLFPFHSWAAPAYASAPAPVAKSKGMTPNTKANEVIRIGRKRDTAESSIASRMDKPANLRWLANSTIKIPFFETNPTNMMIPIWLKMFMVCPKYHKATIAPINANGTVNMMINGSRKLSNCAASTK